MQTELDIFGMHFEIIMSNYFHIVLAVCFISCTTAKIYKQEEADTTNGWTPFVYKEHTGLKSIIMCGATCNRDPNCGTYSFSEDTSTCQLADKSVECQPVTVSCGTTKFHRAKLEEGDEVPLVERGLRDVKSDWEATVSSFYSPDFTAEKAIDGASNSWNSLGVEMTPWLRIRMHRQAWVKGVRVEARVGHENKLKYTEIRVGNDDILSGTGTNEILCQNQLCSMIRDESPAVYYSDCATPLRGRYITLQHNNLPLGPRTLDVSEIGVVFYCEAHPIEWQAPCMPVEVNTCQNRNLKTNNVKEASTQSDKTNWQLTASSNWGPFSLSSLKNGQHVATGVWIYAAKDAATSDDKYPWIQIELEESKVVKAVHMYSRGDNDRGEAILYTEVRVGEINAAEVVQLGERICVNAVCFTTGGGMAPNEQKHDCSGGSPIQGKFITMQRYDYKRDTNGNLLHGTFAMSEVDVQFYI